MKSNELAPPEIKSVDNSFQLDMHHRTIYTKDEILWLSHFDKVELSTQEKSIVLLGRGGELISPQNIIDRAGIIDIEQYRQLLVSLKKKNLINTEVSKQSAKRISRKDQIGIRDVPRFMIVTDQNSAPSEIKTNSKPQRTADSAEEKQGYYEVFVGNLPKKIDRKKVYEAFAQFGDIERVYVKPGTGYGFVGFSKEESQQTALAVGLIVIAERKCGIRPVNSQQKYSKMKS